MTTPTTQAQERALLPCPFCGGNADQRTEHDADMVRWGYVACSSCGARTSGSFGDLSWAEIRAEWNRRATLPSSAAPEGVVAWAYEANFIPHPDRDDGIHVTRRKTEAEVNGLPGSIKPLVYAQSAGEQTGPVPARPTSVEVLIARLQACIDDPMWADHAEVSKRTLRDAIAAVASLPPEQEAQQPVSMADAIAAGDGTLHGAIDHWQRRALAAEQAAQAEPAGMRLVSVEQLKRWERWADQHYSTSIRNAIAALLAAPAQASEQAEQVQEPLSETQATNAALESLNRAQNPARAWAALTCESGPYDLTKLNWTGLQLVRAIERACATAWGVQLTKEGGNG